MSATTPEGAKNSPLYSRRRALLGTTAALAAGVVAAASSERGRLGATERFSFHGQHQAGVTTRLQDYLAFGTFDVTATQRDDLVRLLRRWSKVSARLVEGKTLDGPSDPTYPAADTGETVDVSAAGLTVTIGFGPTLFDHRFALSHRRPAALVELPLFPGDRLDRWRTGGDICVQACADDPLVAFHAVRNLTRVASGTATLRSLQFGTGPTSTNSKSEQTPRNLMGFKDGTSNLSADSPSQMRDYVWVGGNTDQSWMQGGTYLVARRIRMNLEEWSSLPLQAQQSIIGRFRHSGAPLSGRREHDPLDFNAAVFGDPVIPVRAHVRAASSLLNNGAQILRRGYNFADGVDARTGELDAGLMFICFQKDPRHQFITLQNNLATQDALSDYTVHTGSGIFACPGGASVGGWVGQSLFK